MEDLRNKRAGVMQDEILRQDILGRVQEIAKILSFEYPFGCVSFC